MRKIKITALLLAVLMIVTAFAGCASKSTVTNLDNKVNDLDNKIQEQADALAGIQSSLKDISDALGTPGSSTELDDIKADVEANKQNVADILAAIESLKDAVAGATGENEDVKTAISKAGAKIDALKGAYEDDKDNYKAEDLAAIREILGDAQASISACVAADAVAAALADMETKLAAYKSVNGALYEAVVALKGNITDDSAADVEKLYNALVDAATDFYKDGFADKNLTEYKADGEKVDLVKEINDLKTMQETALPALKIAAKELVKAIDKAAADYDDEALYEILALYKTWARQAEKLSPKNLELVTNYNKLTEALEAAQNVQLAKTDFEKVWKYAAANAGIYEANVGIFGDYDYLAEDYLQAAFLYETYDAKGDWTTARVVDIYDEIDERLAEFKAEYALNDAALEYIVESVYGDEYYLEKYESDKALAKAFAAEYDKLVGGVFAEIKAMNTKVLNATVALDLVNAYKKNATDINAWKDALIAAYKAEYDADETADETRNYDKYLYAEILEWNFYDFAYEAKMGVLVDKEEGIYDVEWYGFLKDVSKKEIVGGETNPAYYHGLYDFGTAKNTKLEDFLLYTFPQADDYATKINEKIANFKENQAESIVALAEQIGGYHLRVGNKLVAADLDHLAIAMADENSVPTTVAEFIAKYNRPDKGYDLSGLINSDLYNEKFAKIEKNIENAEKALKDLMNALEDVHDEKVTVVVTTDNMNKIIALKALLTNWHQLGRIDMEKATLKETNATGVKEYELAYVLEPYAGEEREAFYYAVLYTLEYTKTKNDTDTIDTGWIMRLINKAEQLQAEAAMVKSAYEMVAKQNAAGAYTFDYLQVGAANVNKIYDATEADLVVYGATEKVSATAKSGKFVTFENGTFQEKTFSAADTAKLKETLADKAFGAAIAGNNNEEMNYNLNEYLFGDAAGSLKDQVANKDYEAFRTNLWGKTFPAYVLPMLAMYLEAKFEINNMGIEYAAIESAKNGWAEADYGYAYIHGLTVARLRYDATVSFTDIELSAVKNAKNLEELRVAVNNAIMVEAADGNNWNDDITFGDGEAFWLAKTYDIRVWDYYDGNYEVLTSDDLYAEIHGIDLAKIAEKTIIVSVWEAEDVCQHQAPAGTPCCTSYQCVLCNTLVEDACIYDANSIKVVAILNADDGVTNVPSTAQITIGCSKACCVGEVETEYVGGITYNDANTSGTLDDGDVVTFVVEVEGIDYLVTCTRGNGEWAAVVTVA